MNFSIKVFLSKCDQIRSADLVTFTAKIPDGKLHFLWSVFPSDSYTYALVY